MSPKRIIERAQKQKLDIIGICDHNSAENTLAAIHLAGKAGIALLCGIEITSTEEIHILAFFDSYEETLTMQQLIYDNLPPDENTEEYFGEQIIVNESDEVEGYSKRLLIGATSLTLETIVHEIHERKGLAIASHIDRETYSIISQLGFIPSSLKLDAVEVSSHMTIQQARTKFPQIDRFPLITGSDAHFLDDIGKITTRLMLAEATIDEIRMGLNNENGRKVIPEA
jgi:predicted metal-dependent phosphoesterase TrpH